MLSGTLVPLAHGSLKHQIWANKLSQRTDHSADVLRGCAYIKPAADMLQKTRFRLAVWRAAAGVRQAGWKASLFLHSSKACSPLLLIQSARPISLWLLSLGCAAHGTFVPPPDLRAALQPCAHVHTAPAGTHPGSRPTAQICLCTDWHLRLFHLEVDLFTACMLHVFQLKSSKAAFCLKLPPPNSGTKKNLAWLFPKLRLD